ncbi:MAG: thioredoxin-disulfide reductase [Bacteroidales bacterium]|nr:thioredoxin-disulfide reductase [Bacteroidales bacterium]
MKADTNYDVIVLGAGPAGLTAGIYLSRARIRTLIINEGTVGGQMVLTHEIANYPGVEKTSGYQLSGIMKKQARSFGCEIIGNSSVSDLQLEGAVKSVRLSDGREYKASAVILAPGGRPRQLGVPGEETFRGKGISYCATCDGDFFTGKEIIVVGGGNSALEEAVSLTKYASRVTVVHQFDHFQAFEYAIEEARSNPSIRFILSSTIAAFHGNENLQSVDIKNLKTGELYNMPIDGVFIFIGYVPNTEFLRNQQILNERGEIIVNADMETGIKGVFAAGDAVVKRFRQVTTAVGDGTVAALAAAQYVHNLRQLELAEA